MFRQISLRCSDLGAVLAAGQRLRQRRGLPAGQLKGRVTVGGQPLAEGRILFLPVAPNSGPAVSAPIVAATTNCRKRGSGGRPEPRRGGSRTEPRLRHRRRGRLRPARREAAASQSIPPEFNRQSQFVVEVQAGEENTFDVAIPQSRHVATR